MKNLFLLISVFLIVTGFTSTTEETASIKFNEAEVREKLYSTPKAVLSIEITEAIGNPDGSHTVSWVATPGEFPTKYLNVGVFYGTKITAETRGYGVYSWSEYVNSNVPVEYSGTRTRIPFEPKASWCIFVAYIVERTGPDGDDQNEVTVVTNKIKLK